MSLRSARVALGWTTVMALVLSACQIAPPTPVAPTAAPTAEAGGALQAGPIGAHVDLTQGTAQWRPNGQSAFQPVTGGFDLPIGGELRTDAQGQATLAFLDGSRVSLDKSSQVTLDAYDVDGTTPDTIATRLGRLHLTTGNLTFDVKALPGASAFEFRTDDYVAVIRGLSGTLSFQPAPTGQTSAGDFVLTMSQGTALVGCVVQDLTANAPKVNILQAGLGQPVHPSPGTCQSVQSMPDPARAAGLLDAYGIALSGPADAITSVANGDLPGALDKLTAAWTRGVPQPFFPGATPSAGTLADTARRLSNGTILQILQPAVPAPGPQGPQGPLGPPGPAGPVGPAGPPGNLSDIKRLDTLEVAGALALGGETIANAPIRANSGITVTGDQPLLIDDAGGIVVGNGPAQLGGGLSVRGGAGVVGDLSVTGRAVVDTLITSGPTTLNSLSVGSDAQLQGALNVAQSARINGDLAVGGTEQVGALSVSGNSSTDTLSVGRDASVGGNATVGGSEAIGGDVNVGGNAAVAGSQTVGGDVLVSGGLAVAGPARLSRGTIIDGAQLTTSTLVSPVVQGGATTDSLQVSGDALVGGALNVAGPTSLRGGVQTTDLSATNMTAAGNVTAGGQLMVQGGTSVGGALAIAKDVTAGGNVTAEGNLTIQPNGAPGPSFQVVAATGDTFVGGKLSIGNDLSVNSEKFVVNSSDGSTTLKGGVLTVANATGAPQFQVSPATGLINVASRGGIDNLAGGPAELDVGTANSTNINIGNPTTGTLSLSNNAIDVESQTLNVGRGDKTTAVNLGNSATGQITLGNNTVSADAATVNIGTQAAKNIKLGNNSATEVSGNAQSITFTGGNSFSADAPTIDLGATAGRNITIGNNSVALMQIQGGAKFAADATSLNLGTNAAGQTASLSIGNSGTGSITLANNTLTANAGTLNLGQAAGATVALGQGAGANISIGSGAANAVTLAGGQSLSADAAKVTMGANASSITLGNANADTTLALTGGPNWSIAPNGNFTTNGSIAIAPGQSLDTTAPGALSLGGKTATTVSVGNGNAATKLTGNGASVSIGDTSGTLTLTGNAESTWDLGGHTLNLQTTRNGQIVTGNGQFTAGGPLEVKGTTTLDSKLDVKTGGAAIEQGGLTIGTGNPAGDLNFSGSSGATINGPANHELKVASSGPLTLTGGASSSWDLGATNTLTLQSSGGPITTGGALSVTKLLEANGGIDTAGTPLTIGAANATRVAIGNTSGALTTGTVTLDSATQTLSADAPTVDLGTSTNTTVNVGNTKATKVTADAATVAVGPTANTKVTIGNNGATSLTADAQTLTIGSATGSKIQLGNSDPTTTMSLLGGSAWSIDKDGSITTTGTITASAKGIEGKGGTLNLGAASTTITMGNSANTNTIDAEAGTITIGTATGSTPKITIGNNDTGTTLSLTSGKGATSWSVDGTTGKGTFASLEVSPGGTLTVGGGTAITWIAEGTVQCKNGVGTATFPKNAPASPEIVLSADTSNLIVQVTSINPDFSGFSFSCSQLGVTKNKQLNVPSTGLSASSSTITISGTDSKGDSFSGSATPSISVGGSAQTDAFDLVTLDSSAATGKVHYVAMTH